MMAQDPGEKPLVLVSADTHIGPRPKDLRDYCPAAYLSDYDDYLAAIRQAAKDSPFGWDAEDPQVQAVIRNGRTRGHFDMNARLADMDADGVAAEVVFHGSQNGQPVPFADTDFFGSLTRRDSGQVSARKRELEAAGIRMYNRWLADVCSVEAERHIGLAHLPIWDVEGTLAEVAWAHEAGLRGLNFPAPRTGVVEYDRPEWEPLWSVCEDMSMALTTHAGAGNSWAPVGPHSTAVVLLETAGGWMSRRGVHWMIFSGVFHRHPGLRMVLTEQPGSWWTAYLAELDMVYRSAPARRVRQVIPELPSEACRRSLFVGASFIAPFEALDAEDGGYTDRLLWGSDYPHVEGTWQAVPDTDTPTTHLALRHALAGRHPDTIRAITGENAALVYGLDLEALRAVAARINAPTVAEITVPLDIGDVPEGLREYSMAFRDADAWV